MGAESSLLNDVNIGESIHSNDKRGWDLHKAKKADGSRVSAFVYQLQTKSSSGERLENLVKHLKTIRHPTIMKFLAYGKISGNHVLVTEPVQCLDQVIEGLSPCEILAGMYNVIEAITFLHEAASVCHNNICMSSIFVGADGAWKLGGMECACSIENLSENFIERCTASRDSDCIPPEDKLKSGAKSTPPPPHARDSFGFGALAEQLMEYLVELGPLTQSFDQKLQTLMHDDPASRPKVKSLLQDKLFKNDFMEIARFLRNITLKSERDKEKFFKNLVPRLLQLPADLIATRLATLLLSRFVLLDESADRYLVPHLLTSSKVRNTSYLEDEFNAILPDKLFRLHIIPELYKIFHVRDAHIRLVLLRNFSNYAHMFDKETLRSVIIPQLLVGLRDFNDEIVELSLRSLADLVPVLGGDIIVGGKRVKYFSEGKPKFQPGSSMKLNHTDRRCNNTPNGRHSSLHNHIDNHVENEERPDPKPPRPRPERKGLRLSQTAAKQSQEPVDLNFENETPVSPRHQVTAVGPTRNENDSISAADKSQHVGGEEDGWSDWEDPADVMDKAECDMEETDLKYTESEDLNAEARQIFDNGYADVYEELETTHVVEVIPSHSSFPPGGRGLKLKSNQKEVNSILQADQLGKTDMDVVKTVSGTTSKAGSAKGSTHSSPRHNPDLNLGAEFDVKMIDVKKKETHDEIDDLFADMQPKIKTDSLDLLTMLAKAEETQRNMEARQMERMREESKVLLAYNTGDQAEEDAGGWGDDLDWCDQTTEDALK
ncbi:protein-associating with the carboxyl-terminal domain of ezrin-like [Lineus longissimus]|uniref:protein-associating with the carboxyl-terminal domain of ezrin-like n=1 Tax=Lineus longissimus TaxID=88925 RepID=UPI002B4D66DA